MLDQSETRQGAPWISEWSTIPEMFMLTAASLDCANRLFARLIVRPDVMFAHFDDSKGFVMAEAVMMNIAPKVGRGAAYDVIKAAIDSAPAGVSFKEVIRGSPNLLDLVGESNIDPILDPRNYLGAAPAMVDAAVVKTRSSFI
jgi:adenylosuccinate lyase